MAMVACRSIAYDPSQVCNLYRDKTSSGRDNPPQAAIFGELHERRDDGRHTVSQDDCRPRSRAVLPYSLHDRAFAIRSFISTVDPSTR